jgi:hypothetical protein
MHHLLSIEETDPTELAGRLTSTHLTHDLTSRVATRAALAPRSTLPESIGIRVLRKGLRRRIEFPPYTRLLEQPQTTAMQSPWLMMMVARGASPTGQTVVMALQVAKQTATPVGHRLMANGRKGIKSISKF